MAISANLVADLNYGVYYLSMVVWVSLRVKYTGQRTGV